MESESRNKVLYDDQTDTISRLDNLLEKGKRRIVIQAPTGFGKTLVAAEIIRRERERGNWLLFVVPAIALIDQTINALYEHGIEDIGVMQATHEMTDWREPIQIASVQTLQRRKIPPSHLVLVDEVHRFWDFYGKWFMDPDWKDVPIIGLSATPWTKGLGAYFSDLLVAGTTEEMIAKGRLSDFKVFAPHSPDLRGVRTLAGDFHEGDLSLAMNKATLVADIVSTWQRLGQDRPTLVFAVDRAHAKNIQNQFLAAGIPAGYQDAFTKDDERKMIKARFHDGALKVVCNVGTLTTGVDWDVRAIILARPTKSEILFVQIIGRGLRTADGKDHCLILDHSDTHLRLGFVTDIHHDTLHDGTKQASAKVDGILLPKKCPKCSYLKPPKCQVCPSCGFKAEAQPNVEVVKGKLSELERKKNNERFWADKRSIYSQFLTLARMEGKKEGWAYFKYVELYNEKPPWEWKNDPPTKLTPEVMQWVASRNIAYANSKYRANSRSLIR